MPDGIADLRRVIDGLERARVTLLDIGLRRPTLDDVFLALTGHGTESADGSVAETKDQEVAR